MSYGSRKPSLYFMKRSTLVLQWPAMNLVLLTFTILSTGVFLAKLNPMLKLTCDNSFSTTLRKMCFRTGSSGLRLLEYHYQNVPLLLRLNHCVDISHHDTGWNISFDKILTALFSDLLDLIQSVHNNSTSQLSTSTSKTYSTYLTTMTSLSAMSSTSMK